MRTALTIAGSDSSGGAGIQADIKAMTLNGVYAMSAITALTAQNTLGVIEIQEVAPDFLGKQMDAVFQDIFPDAVKVGMVSSAALIEVIADRLKHYGARHVVVDPVMVASSGRRLLREDALAVLRGKLLPLAELVTPNLPEAEILANREIRSTGEMVRAAEVISEDCGTAVLLKGGHAQEGANDYLCGRGIGCWIKGERIDNPNAHGTGCTLSSAIAANLAKGFALEEAVVRAKCYLTGALAARLDLGAGPGPMDHAFDIKPEYREECDHK